MAYVFRTRNRKGVPHQRWRFQYTDWTGRRRTATGTESKLHTTKLANRVQAQHDEIRKGFRPPPDLWDEVGGRPFEDVYNEYVAWGKTQGGRRGHPWSARHAKYTLARLRFWQESLSIRKLSDLNGCLPKVEQELARLHEAGRSGKTLQNYAEALNTFCRWCEKREYLQKNPLKNLSPFDNTPNSRRRSITAEEIQGIMSVAPEHRQLLYATAICSGLRVGELRALSVSDLDLVAGGIWLHAEWTKNRRDGFQPLPHALLEKLGEFVDTGTAGSLYEKRHVRRDATSQTPKDPVLYVPTHCARELSKDLASAGIPKETPRGKLDFHALRVAYVSFCLEVGAGAKEAQQLARHATPELTMNVYARTRETRLTEIAEAVGRFAFNFPNTTSTQQKIARPATRLPLARYKKRRSIRFPPPPPFSHHRLHSRGTTALRLSILRWYLSARSE